MALEIDRRDLTNRVTTSFTLVGNGADFPEPLRRPSPDTGHEAEILDVYNPYLAYDAETFPYQQLHWLSSRGVDVEDVVP
jgi:hypothetical protein